MRFESRHIGNKRVGGGMMIRMILMGAILILLLLLILKKGGDQKPSPSRYVRSPDRMQVVYWPAEHNQLIHYTNHTLSYNPQYKQADWVAYVLTREDLEGEESEWLPEFLRDPDLEDVARPEDYLNTDYVMGQLLPYEDRPGSQEDKQEIFYMSNVTPQKKEFNQGVWRELEENIRDWARSSGRLYIVTGPVLNGGQGEMIGTSQVFVPEYFFKAILDIDGSEPKMIGFLIPNEGTDAPLESFATSIDEIESLTKIDFFKSILLDQKLEDSLESEFDIGQWPIDPSRYQRRVERWNEIKIKE